MKDVKVSQGSSTILLTSYEGVSSKLHLHLLLDNYFDPR